MIGKLSALRELLPGFIVYVQYVLVSGDDDDPDPVPMYQVRAMRRDPERNNEWFAIVTSVSKELVEDAAVDVADLVASQITKGWNERRLDIATGICYT